MCYKTSKKYLLAAAHGHILHIQLVGAPPPAYRCFRLHGAQALLVEIKVYKREAVLLVDFRMIKDEFSQQRGFTYPAKSEYNEGRFFCPK